jgi:protein gp37
MATRLAGRCGYPPAPHHFDVTLHRDKFGDPLRWKKPQRIFVCSMSDLFHENVPSEVIRTVFTTMGLCPQHTFMLLTKRPLRMRNFIDSLIAEGDFFVDHWWGRGEVRDYLPNVWLGVTAENQARADERIPILLQTPAAKRFVSCEPLLAPIDLNLWLPHQFEPGDAAYGWERQCSHLAPDGMRHCGYPPEQHPQPSLSWVIAGAESGAGRRPAYPAWFRWLRNQCESSGVPYFLKQMEVDGKLLSMPTLDCPLTRRCLGFEPPSDDARSPAMLSLSPSSASHRAVSAR